MAVQLYFEGNPKQLSLRSITYVNRRPSFTKLLYAAIAISTSPCLPNHSSRPPRVRPWNRFTAHRAHHALPLLTRARPSRQAHRPPNPSRAQSLLRQRAHVPIMAQLHRHHRRPGHWHAQLWRPGRLHLRLSLHRRRHAHHDLRPHHLPLACQVDTHEGPGWL